MSANEPSYPGTCRNCGHCPCCGQPRYYVGGVPIRPYDPYRVTPWIWPDYPNPYIGDLPQHPWDVGLGQGLAVTVTTTTSSDFLPASVAVHKYIPFNVKVNE